jgi:type IV secretory pathway protease TraF
VRAVRSAAAHARAVRREVPTLGVYDRILVQKAFFTWHDVREGDIVVFSEPPLDDCPGPPGDLVKRVIALPGQTIYSSGNSIYVLGDNRSDSCDSRFWGPIKGSTIVGRVVLTFLAGRPPHPPLVLSARQYAAIMHRGWPEGARPCR